MPIRVNKIDESTPLEEVENIIKTLTNAIFIENRDKRIGWKKIIKELEKTRKECEDFLIKHKDKTI